MSNDREHLDAMAQAITDEYLYRQALSFLECAINLMATIREPEHVAMILRDEAEILETYG